MACNAHESFSRASNLYRLGLRLTKWSPGFMTRLGVQSSAFHAGEKIDIGEGAGMTRALT